jgi:pyruvate,water dikinase
LHELLKSEKYEHILKKYKSAKDLAEWYEGEITRLATQLRDHLDTPKEGFYRQELEKFRGTFHKPVIYAAWDWESTVSDALHHSGFKDYAEQAKALAEQRKKSW